MEYGIQLYSVRDTSETDMEGTLRKLSDIGYVNMEFAGFFGHSAAEVKDWLNQYGLKASGAHCGFQELTDDYTGTIAYHKAIGNRNYIIPWENLNTKAEVDRVVKLINEMQPRLAADGMVLSYHNHSHEFMKNEDGIVPYDELVRRTNINLEIDIYWAWRAGKNPVQMMEEMKDRVTFIHIKDGLDEGEGTPLGQGKAPVDACYRKAAELGIPMIVESETLTPDGMTEAEISFDFLKKME